MSRVPLIIGNWKMHCVPGEARSLARGCVSSTTKAQGVEIAVLPPFTSLLEVAGILVGTHVSLGAQHCHWEKSGAFTGEISAAMLKEAGCDYVLAGHSERRKLFGETDEMVCKKMHAIVRSGMTGVLCIGETLEERDSGRTMDVVHAQLAGGLAGFGAADMQRVVIAYEPVWAIGTGRNASPVQAQEVHAAVRGRLLEQFGKEICRSIRILYGGSVKPENAAELLAQGDIDGALVGGASLDSSSFARIAVAAQVRNV